MKKGILFLMFCFATSAFASELSPFHLLGSGLDFAAPIVSNSSNYTNQLPFGSIVYDANTDQFQGLNRSGSWVALSGTSGGGNVSSNGSGNWRVETVNFTDGASPTINQQSGSWVTGISYNSGTAVMTLTFASAEFSTAPICTCAGEVVPGSFGGPLYFCSVVQGSVTTSQVEVYVNPETPGSDVTDLMCQGQH